MTKEIAIEIFNELLLFGKARCTQAEFKELVEMSIKALEQEPKRGHWTEEFNDLEGEVRFTCSSCGKYQLFGTDFCYHCGADMREVEE